MKASGSRLEIVGESSVTLDSLLKEDAISEVKRPMSYRCLSDGPVQSVWRGYPIDALLSEIDVSDETTHVLIESVGDHRACVPIQDAIEGLLAFERDFEPLDGLRFVAPEIPGPRSLKNLRRLEFASIPPGEDPHTYESL